MSTNSNFPGCGTPGRELGRILDVTQMDYQEGNGTWQGQWTTECAGAEGEKVF